MNNSRKPGVLSSLPIVLWLVFSAGCANVIDNQDLPDDERVRIRAQAWADALMAGDFETAYSFTSPNYRQYASAGRYHAEIAGSNWWTSIEVKSVTCSEDVCDVRYMVDYTTIAMTGGRSGRVSNRRPLDYKWVAQDGRWWLYVPIK